MTITNARNNVTRIIKTFMCGYGEGVVRFYLAFSFAPHLTARLASERRLHRERKPQWVIAEVQDCGHVTNELKVPSSSGVQFWTNAHWKSSAFGWGRKTQWLHLCWLVRSLPPTNILIIDTKQSNGEVSVVLELWTMRRILFFAIAPIMTLVQSGRTL